MEVAKPFICMIYGFSLEESEVFSLSESSDPDIKIWHAPFYNDPTSPEIRFVGIQFNRMDCILANLTFGMGDKFRISNVTPSEEIIRKMRSEYPLKDLKPLAFYQNVYTSHYYSFIVGYGDIIKTNLNSDNLDSMINFTEESPHNQNVKAFDVVHVTPIKENMFVGVDLTELSGIPFKTFEFTDVDGSANRLYEILTYEFPACRIACEFKCHTKPFTPKFYVVGGMCYCCT